MKISHVICRIVVFLLGIELMSGNINGQVVHNRSVRKIILKDLLHESAAGTDMSEQLRKILEADSSHVEIVVGDVGCLFLHSLKVPGRVTMTFDNGGSFYAVDGVKIEIEGEVVAGMYEIFSGPGQISLYRNTKCRVIYPQWWGAFADGHHADDEAIQRAIQSLDQGVITFPPGNYLLSKRIMVPNYLLLQGSGEQWTRMTATSNFADSVMIQVGRDFDHKTGRYDFRHGLAGFEINCSDRVPIAIYSNNLQELSRIEHLAILNYTTVGLMLEGFGCQNFKIQDLHIASGNAAVIRERSNIFIRNIGRGQNTIQNASLVNVKSHFGLAKGRECNIKIVGSVYSHLSFCNIHLESSDWGLYNDGCNVTVNNLDSYDVHNTIALTTSNGGAGFQGIAISQNAGNVIRNFFVHTADSVLTTAQTIPFYFFQTKYGLSDPRYFLFHSGRAFEENSVLDIDANIKTREIQESGKKK
jgi:hypothetical protein